MTEYCTLIGVLRFETKNNRKIVSVVRSNLLLRISYKLVSVMCTSLASGVYVASFNFCSVL